jgi:hypothetical protein
LVYNIASAIKSYHAVSATNNAVTLYQNLPVDATLTLDRLTRVVVQPVINGLAPGVYRDSITLQFTDGRRRTEPCPRTRPSIPEFVKSAANSIQKR